MNKGKKVDDGNNLVGGIGGLNSFSNMAGANYKEYYQDLLEGNEMKGLPQEYKNYLGSGNDNINNQKEIKINNIDDNNNSGNNNGKNMLDLFNKPNKFAKAGKEYSYTNKGKK